MMGDDAMKQGFISKEFGNNLIKRVNRIFRAVHLPPFLKGSAKFIEDENTVELDLSNLKLSTPGLTGGAPANPYHMLTVGVIGPRADQWDIEDGPTTDGVTPVADAETYDGVYYGGDEFLWDGYFDEGVGSRLEHNDSGGDSQVVEIFKMTYYRRPLTYNASGQLTHIGPHAGQTIPNADAGGVYFVGNTYTPP